MKHRTGRGSVQLHMPTHSWYNKFKLLNVNITYIHIYWYKLN